MLYKGESKTKRINYEDREKLTGFLKKFYEFYPSERYTVFHFVRYFKERLKKNKDAWVGVSGDTSTGKSYFVLMSMILFGRPMNLVDNVAYIPKGDAILKMFDKLRFQCLAIDEAAREMRAVNWQSRAQQGVNIKAMTDRFRNNMVFLLMPDFNEFTKSMRRGSIKFRAIMLYRTDNYARVVIQMKSRNWRSDDPWYDQYANLKYEAAQKRFKELNNGIILDIERKMPNTVMDFIVPNLEVPLPEVVAEYEYLKEKSREDSATQDSLTKPDRFKVNYNWLMAKVTKILYFNKLELGVRPKISKKDLCQALDVSSSMFDKYLRMPIPKTYKEILHEEIKEKK